MALFEHKIFFGNPGAQFDAHKDEILKAIEGVCSSGQHVLGPVVEDFERAFADWNGAAHAIGVGSGTDALQLALGGFGIGAGDEVITVSHTALPTASAIVAAGAKPVLIDVDPQRCVLDPARLEAALTDKTKAIIPVHLYGFVCDMEAICAFAKAHNLVVIEDCAQAHGATYRGQKVGAFGDAGCFSFYPTKNLGAIGDGGAVITDNEDAARIIRQKRQYGWDEARVAHMTGSVSRLDPIQAAVLSVKLKYLEADIEARRKIAALYDDLIDWKKYTRPEALADTNPAYHLYVIMVEPEKRCDIIERFAAQNVMLGVHYEYPVHKNPAYAALAGLPTDGLTHTENLSNSVLSLPIYPELPSSSVERIVEYLNDL